MTATGIVLYGPPASGKDTISAELTRVDNRFHTVYKLKAGSGRSNGYKMVDQETIAALRAAGRIALEHSRYGNTYAIDRLDVEQLLAAGRIPVVHVGRVDDLRTVTANLDADWFCVLLWCSRATTMHRSKQRGDSDTAKRLQVWTVTRAELGDELAPLFDLAVRTDLSARPDAIAAKIASSAVEHRVDTRGVRHLLSQIRRDGP